jgi:uncharacterized membrane protein YhaH (DUF805 family)
MGESKLNNLMQKHFVDIFKHKYADFNGRASRTEYWMFTLYCVIVNIALTLIELALDITGISLIFNIIILVPSVAITARRLHDVDKSGWWQLILFIPIIGLIVWLVWMVRPSQVGSNRFGANPHEITAAVPVA